MSDFENYICENNLDISKLYNIMEEYLLHQVFVYIFNILEKDNNKILLKEKLLLCDNSVSRDIIVKGYIKSILPLKFTCKQEQYLSSAIYAYLRKSSTRKNNNIELKKELFIKQNGRCNICDKNFSTLDMELDHKLAFDFVGDELENNIQLICKECNRFKGKNYNYVLNKFLLQC